MTDAAAVAKEPLSSYQKRLFIFLSVATFFEGFDFIALSQVLPELRADFGLSPAAAGWMVGAVKLGTVAAFLLVRAADRFGRKSVLTVTIAGYMIFTFLTGVAPNVYFFAVVQFLAHMFLIAEGAVAMVMAAEEMPASRRGMVIGVIGACSALGAIVCVGVVPPLLDTAYGWRSVYFVGIVPLVILAYARRGLKESGRFLEAQAARGDDHEQGSLFALLRTPHRKRVIQLGIIWSLTFFCTNNAVTWWKQFAMDERGFTKEMVSGSITLAALVSMPLVFYAGKLLDQIGRRRGAVVIFSVSIVGVLSAYGLHGRWPLTIALTAGIFGASAVLPVLNAFTTELVPTSVRADTFAWANNVIGRIGYVTGPIVVGQVADTYGFGTGVHVTTLGLVGAIILILLWLPETGGRELEEIEGVADAAA